MVQYGQAQVTIYYEDFEGATAQTYNGNSGSQAISGLTGWQYVCSNNGGGLETDLIANSGTKSMAMYEASGSVEPLNEVILTYDMSSYSLTDSIELDFYVLHNNDEDDDHDRVWIRGDSSSNWIEVLDLDPILTTSNDGEWLHFVIDVDAALEGASQSFTSSFQARFGQQDNASWSGGDGIAYDDVSLVVYEYGVNISGSETVCFNQQDAALSAEVILGNSPFTYIWSNGATTANLTNLGPGNYCVTVTDNGGQTTSNCFQVTETDSILVSTSIVQPLICDYDTSEVLAQGSGGLAFSSAYVMDTTSSNYEWDSTGTCSPVIVTGGTVSPSIPIGFDFEFYGNTYDEFEVAGNGFIGFGGGLDNGCCAGEPLPDASTAEPNNAIFASWFDVDNFTEYSYCLAGEAPFRRLIVNFIGLGDCTTDDNMTGQIILYETTNCIEIQTDYMTFDGCYNTSDDNTQGMQNLGGTEASVYPGRNGEAWEADDSYVQFCPVGSNGLYYEWSSGDVGEEVTGLSEGTHYVSVSDAYGCTAVDSVELTAISSLDATPAITDVSCFGFDDGGIDPAITSGAPPYAYAWSNNETTATLSDLEPGTYSVTVSDNAGCFIEVSDLTVWEPEQLSANVYALTNVDCPGDENGEASVQVAGGTPPYSYAWTPSGLTGASVTGLSDGAYNVAVTDGNGCQSYVAVSIVAMNTAPVVNLGPDIYNPGGANATLSAGTHSSYLWSNASTASTITVTQTGTYWVEATNAAGCSSRDTVYVEIWPTGLEELGEGRSLSVFPNPTNGQLSLLWESTTDLKSVNVTITNTTGSVVMTESHTALSSGNAINMNVADLPAGVYSISIENADISVVRSFVKK